MSSKKKRPDGDSPEQGSFDLDTPAPKTSLAAKAVKPPGEEAPPVSPQEAEVVLEAREPSNPDMSEPPPGNLEPPSATPAGTGQRPPAGAPGGRSRSSEKRLGARRRRFGDEGLRLMGVVREQVFAFMFGTTMFADAFIAAFRIPNLLRDLFAEAPVVDRVHHDIYENVGEGGRGLRRGISRGWCSRRWRLVLGAICVLCVIFGPEVVYLTSSGAWGEKQPETFALTVSHDAGALPVHPFRFARGGVMGMLNARHIFFAHPGQARARCSTSCR